MESAGPDAAGLDATGLERYARQLVLGAVGPGGQARLGDASVLVVGAGGLGSPVLQYLAGAGVATIAVVDPDVVERSNLHRQTIHGEADVGRPKVESAADFVADLNPDVHVETYEDSLTTEFAAERFPEADLVVDGTDDFDAHFRCNDAAVLTGTPLVAGGIGRFEGQLTTVLPGSFTDSTNDQHGPCYRCLFPEAPPAGTVPDCATAGVLGALPGTIGTLQATEALKLVLDVGDPLVGRLLVYDALGMSVDEVEYERRPACPVCSGDLPGDPTNLVYDDRCRLR
jgi:adenylyltransferase/sulfurtransferase